MICTAGGLHCTLVFGLAYQDSAVPEFLANRSDAVLHVLEKGSCSPGWPLLLFAEVAEAPQGCVIDEKHGRLFFSDYGSLDNKGAVLHPGGIAVVDARSLSHQDVLHNTIVLAHFPRAMVLNPDSATLYVACDSGTTPGSGVLITIDTRTEAVLTTAPLGGSPMGMVMDEETKRLFVTCEHPGSSRWVLRAIDSRTSTQLFSCELYGQPASIGIDRTTGCIYVSYRKDDCIRIVAGRIAV